jgi:hypothetical protein
VFDSKKKHLNKKGRGLGDIPQMPIHPNARRCIYYRLDGQRCGSPAMLNKGRCYHHEEIIQRRNRRKVEMLKSPAEHQQAVMDVIAGLVARRLDRKDANSVLRALKLAQNNLRMNGWSYYLKEFKEGSGMAIHDLLNEADVTADLEDAADVAKAEASWEESQRQAQLAKEYQEAQRKKQGA